MKKVFIFSLASLLLGYFSYPYLNPPEKKDEMLELFREFFKTEARAFTEARTAEQKLKAADAMYEKMMILFLSQLSLKAPANQPVVAPSPMVIVKPGGEIIKIPAEELPRGETKESPKTVAEKILSNQLDLKTYLTFSSLPFLNMLDARIVRLKGFSKGKLTYGVESRTGSEEDAVLDVGAMTKFTVMDSYDNLSMNYSGPSSESFQSVPGDENLLMIRAPESRVIILDLRKLPEISGKVFSLHKHIADFRLKKVK